MSKYHLADSKTQWFQARWGGATMTPNVVVLHTTEGTGWEDYQGGSEAPNYTALPLVGQKKMAWRQHFADECSARALVDTPGGVQTNTLNCVQVELVGTCDPKHAKRWGSLFAALRQSVKQRRRVRRAVAGADYIYWPEAPDWALQAVADFIADQHKRHGTKLHAPTFLPYPASYGNSAVRFTGKQWENFYGVCGHQHIPENDHGDPGDIPIQKILQMAQASVTPAPPPPPAPTPAPKPPKPPVAHKPLEGGNWNVKTGRRAKDVVAAVLDLFKTEHLDFLALCEVSTVLKDLAASPELAKAGLMVLGYPEGDIPSRETCIVVRKGLRVTGKNLHDITAVKWERDPSNKLKSLHPGRKSVSARVSWLRVLAVHTPPPPFGPAFPLRKKANLDAFAKQTTLLKRWAPSWLAAGDWNRKPADAVAKDFAATLGAEITGSGIDWVAGKGVTVSNVRRVANHGSDHKPVLYTVTKA